MGINIWIKGRGNTAVKLKQRRRGRGGVRLEIMLGEEGGPLNCILKGGGLQWQHHGCTSAAALTKPSPCRLLAAAGSSA